MIEPYLKLYTRFLNWEWYKDIPVKTLFLHCLLKANYKEKKCFGQKIERGQFITSIAHLAEETGLSTQQIRTAIEKLKKTKNITSESTNRNTIITVLNWDKYHSEQQTNNKRATTTNNSTMCTISSKPSYSNTHTILNARNSKCVCVDISKEEKQVLINYAKKSKARNIDAYVNTLIQNGGYKEILEKTAANKIAKEAAEKAQREALSFRITDEEREAGLVRMRELREELEKKRRGQQK